MYHVYLGFVAMSKFDVGLLQVLPGGASQTTNVTNRDGRVALTSAPFTC